MQGGFKIEGIILAAGLSSRTGVNKMTLKLGEKTIIESCIEGMLGCCSRIIVVGGHRIDEIVPLVNKYDAAEIFYNRNYSEGMYSSVKEGLKHIRGERFFLTPGDHPLIGREVYSEMLKFNGDIIVAACDGKKGHPVLMKSTLINELVYSDAYNNLRDFINAKGFVIAETFDSGVLSDIDTIMDYQKMIHEYSFVHY